MYYIYKYVVRPMWDGGNAGSYTEEIGSGMKFIDEGRIGGGAVGVPLFRRGSTGRGYGQFIK